MRRLLKIIVGQSPMNTAAALLDDNVAAYMDGKKIARGVHAWRRWVLFLQHNAAKKITDLSLDIKSINTDGDRVTVHACWCGQIAGVPAQSKIGTVVYQINDGKIIAIWTHKANYVFIYGDNIVRTPFFYALLLRLMLWQKTAAD